MRVGQVSPSSVTLGQHHSQRGDATSRPWDLLVDARVPPRHPSRDSLVRCRLAQLAPIARCRLSRASLGEYLSNGARSEGSFTAAISS
jgi:hypothetical protein